MLPAGLFRRAETLILRNSEDLQDENIPYILGQKPNDNTMLLILRKGRKPVLLVSPLEIGNHSGKGVVVKAMEKNLKVKVKVPPEPQIVAALGAAICAREMAGAEENRRIHG